MSLPNQSDIKNHLLRRQRKNLIPFDAASHSKYLDHQRLEQNKASESTNQVKMMTLRRQQF